jgi:hypothetical protein
MTSQPLAPVLLGHLGVYDRPHSAAERDMIAAQTTLADWVQLIRAEYLEIPGLHLTKKQVERLWGLDPVTSEALLGALVDIKFLRCTHAEAYVRADGSG